MDAVRRSARTLLQRLRSLIATFSATGTAISGGGDGGPTLIPYIAISAGDAQSATVQRPVATAPAVHVTASSGVDVSNADGHVRHRIGWRQRGWRDGIDQQRRHRDREARLGTTAGTNTLSATMGSSSVVRPPAPSAAGSITRTRVTGRLRHKRVLFFPQGSRLRRQQQPKPGVTITFAVVKAERDRRSQVTDATDSRPSVAGRSAPPGTRFAECDCRCTLDRVRGDCRRRPAANLAKQTNGDNQSAVAANPSRSARGARHR